MNFKVLAEGIDVVPLLDELAEHPTMWLENTQRQDYPGSSHKDTECIWLRAPDTVEDVFNVIRAYWLQNNLRLLWNTYLEIGRIRDLLTAPLMGRVMLTKLKAGGHITPHTDEGAYARFYARFHLVLKTPAFPRVTFRCGGDEWDDFRAFDAGTLFWFDHQKEHEVWNPSDQERIHLIIDAVAPGFCGALHG